MASQSRKRRFEPCSSSTDPTRKKRRSNTNIEEDISGLSLEPQDNDPITLNVGGKIFTTTIETLTRYNGMLEARFSKRHPIKPSSDGTYFIDVDGNLFKHTLHYLRYGTLILPQTWRRNNFLLFYDQAKYLSIEPLMYAVLLKLINSKIVQNDTLKSHIINKIGQSLKWNKYKTRESIKQWKLLYNSKAFDYDLWTSLQNSLLLIESNHNIYGVFLNIINETLQGISFSFHCQPNIFSSIYDDGNCTVEFRKIRNFTQTELRMNTKYEKNKRGKEFFASYPIIIRSHTCSETNETQWNIKYYSKGSMPTRGYQVVEKWELWSIPT